MSLQALLFLSVQASFAASSPPSAVDLDSRAIALLAAGDDKAAVKLLDRSLAANPKNPQALANRCTGRVRLGRYDGAISDCERALALKPALKDVLAPSFALAYAGRARRKLKAGRKDAARRDARKAISFDPALKAEFAFLLGDL